MELIQAIGKESTFIIGYVRKDDGTDLRCASLVFIEFFWSKKLNKWGFGIGIPFVYSIGLVFNYNFK